MEKPSPILEKRMQELESDINIVMPFPPDTPSDQLDLYHKDFDQRVAFLKNLLSAEITSSPENPPLHLERIQRRLSKIESSFTRRFVSDSEPVLTCLCGESEGGGDEDDVVSQEKVEEKGDAGGKERVGEKRGGFCGGFGVGVVVGMAVMGFVMVSVFECFSCMQHRYPVCLAPT